MWILTILLMDNLFIEIKSCIINFELKRQHPIYTETDWKNQTEYVKNNLQNVWMNYVAKLCQDESRSVGTQTTGMSITAIENAIQQSKK